MLPTALWMPREVMTSAAMPRAQAGALTHDHQCGHIRSTWRERLMPAVGPELQPLLADAEGLAAASARQATARPGGPAPARGTASCARCGRPPRSLVGPEPPPQTASTKRVRGALGIQLMRPRPAVVTSCGNWPAPR